MRSRSRRSKVLSSTGEGSLERLLEQLCASRRDAIPGVCRALSAHFQGDGASCWRVDSSAKAKCVYMTGFAGPDLAGPEVELTNGSLFSRALARGTAVQAGHKIGRASW